MSPKKEEIKEEKFKISGDDLVFLLRKIFKAGYSRNITFKDENENKFFKINLILFALIIFILPILLLILIIYLIITNHSLEIEKRINTKKEEKEESNNTKTTENKKEAHEEKTPTS